MEFTQPVPGTQILFLRRWPNVPIAVTVCGFVGSFPQQLSLAVMDSMLRLPSDFLCSRLTWSVVSEGSLSAMIRTGGPHAASTDASRRWSFPVLAILDWIGRWPLEFSLGPGRCIPSAARLVGTFTRNQQLMRVRATDQKNVSCVRDPGYESPEPG